MTSKLNTFKFLQDAKFDQAHLMLAKWTDRAGQTHSQAIVQRYREAIKLYPRLVLHTVHLEEFF